MKTKQPIGNIRHILLAIVLLAGSLSSIAWLNPEIKSTKTMIKNTAHTLYAAVTNTKPVEHTLKTVVISEPKKQSVVNNYTDTIRDKQLTDTVKKKAKVKIVIEDENGVKKEYASVNDMPDSVRNEFYKNSDIPDLKIHSYTNFKYGDSAKIKAYFNSPAWKHQAEAMKIQGEKMAKYYDSEAWKKQVDGMKLQGEKMEKYYNSPEWKKQVEGMQLQGEKMAKYYDSPEWKKQVDGMKLEGEKMEKYYNSPEWKKQVEGMALQGKQMAEYYKGPEWKKMQEDLVKNAMEMAKHAQDWAKQYGEYDDDGNRVTTEPSKASAKKTTKGAKAAAKKAEAKEKAEQKEQQEKPEPAEKPESNN